MIFPAELSASTDKLNQTQHKQIWTYNKLYNNIK